jgi:hypothetical protein
MGIGEPFAHDAGDVKDRLALLADLEDTFVRMLGHPGPVLTGRHVESLAHRVVELLELTDVAGSIHPNERPLRPLLDRCPHLTAEWDLDTEELSLRLAEIRLLLPILPLPLDGDEPSIDGLAVRVDFSFDPLALPNGDAATVLVHSLVDGELGPYATSLWALLPVLRGALTDHLLDALTTATVLSRTLDRDTSSGTSPLDAELGPDGDVDAGHRVDALLGRYVDLEQALVRRASAIRRPDGTRDGDEEVEASRSRLLDMVTRVRVRARQTLPAGTLEPVLLEYAAQTGHHPDGSGPDHVEYVVTLALDVERRGQGVIALGFWHGKAERSVILPQVCDLWDDHIDSAIRQAHAVVPAVRRTPHAELADPTPHVDPPAADPDWPYRTSAETNEPVPLPPEDAPF